MKKFRKIMAVLVAAMMIVAMWAPAMVWAETTSGRITDAVKGTITIKSEEFQSGETYTAYKILDLASFSDDSANLNPDMHSEDRYAYVIADDSPWKSFVEGAIAVPAIADDPATTDVNEAKDAVKYFEVDPTLIYLKNMQTSTGGSLKAYHVVRPTSKFSNPYKNAGSEGLLDETDNNEWTTASLAQRLAQAAIAYAQGNTNTTTENEVFSGTITGTAAELASGGHMYTANGSGVFNSIPLGYYVVTSSLGTLCALDTTNKNVIVHEKNTLPTITKEVQEDSLLEADTDTNFVNTGMVTQNDAEIGQTIHYKTVVKVSKGAEKYKVRDLMEDGLSFDSGSVKVYLVLPGGKTDEYNSAYWICLTEVNNTDPSAITLNGHTDQKTIKFPGDTATQGDYYDLKEGNASTWTDDDPDTTASEEVKGTFEVIFKQPFLTFLSDQLNAGEVAAVADDPSTPENEAAAAIESTKDMYFVVTYTAKLDKDAVVDTLDANKNYTKLMYGEKSVAGPYSTSTATWSTKIRKYAEDVNRNGTAAGEEPLEKAHFQVKRSDGKVLQFVKEANDAAGNAVYRFDERIQNTSITGWTAAMGWTDGTTDVDTVGIATPADPDDAESTVSVVDTLITTDTGVIIIKGLDGQSYFLKETLAPKGYNQLNGEIEIHITSYDEATASNTEAADKAKHIKYGTAQSNTRITTAGNVAVGAVGETYTADSNGTLYPALGETAKTFKVTDSTTNPVTYADGNIQIGVANDTSAELPSTGGMGTTVLYIVGGMLVILAGAYLFFSRKRTA